MQLSNGSFSFSQGMIALPKEFFEAFATIVPVQQPPPPLSSVQWVSLESHGYQGYMISSTGQVYSQKKNVILQGSLAKNGCRRVKLTRMERTKHHLYIHRLVAIAFLGQPPNESAIVQHKDGNNKNNDISNLAWATKNSGTSIPKTLPQAGQPQWKRNGRRRDGLADPITAAKVDYSFYCTWFNVKDLVVDLKLPPDAVPNIIQARKNGRTAYGYRFYNTEKIETELWKKLEQPGCEPILVSSCGRVKTRKNRVGYGYTNGSGYRECRLNQLKEPGKKAKKKAYRIDELVVKAFYSQGLRQLWNLNSSPNPELLHLNGNLSDNSLLNLAFKCSLSSYTYEELCLVSKQRASYVICYSAIEAQNSREIGFHTVPVIIGPYRALLPSALQIERDFADLVNREFPPITPAPTLLSESPPKENHPLQYDYLDWAIDQVENLPSTLQNQPYDPYDLAPDQEDEDNDDEEEDDEEEDMA